WSSILLLFPELSLVVTPGLLEPNDECPDRLVQRRCHASLLTKSNDPAVECGNFGATMRQRILQHAGLMVIRDLARMVDKLVGVAVQPDTQGSCDRDAFRHQRRNKLA